MTPECSAVQCSVSNREIRDEILRIMRDEKGDWGRSDVNARGYIKGCGRQGCR
jgi:hypothetical protein